MKNLVITIAAGCLLLPGCAEETVNTKQPEPLDGRVKFRIYESYHFADPPVPQMPQIRLGMSTDKWYPCANYAIIHRVSVYGNMILTDIAGVQEPVMCLTAFGPACGGDWLRLVTGSYRLIFSHGDLRSDFVVTVSDSYIRVDGDTTGFMHPESTLYWRYPPNSFVYLFSSPERYEWMYENFLDSLRSRVSVNEFQFPPYGRKPYPDSSGGFAARYFRYESDEDFDDAGEVVRSYKENVIGDSLNVYITLTNWKNKSFYSWMF